MTDKKELNNEELEKVTGGLLRNIKQRYICNACGEEWTIDDKKCDKCKYCGSTNIQKQ